MLRLNYEKKDAGFSFAVAVGMMVTASLVLTLIFGANADGWRFWLMQAIYTVAIGSSAFIYSAIAKVNPIAASGLNVKPRLAHMGWGFLAISCLIFAMMPINGMLMDAIEAVGLNRPAVYLPDDLVGLIVVAAVLPAFCEEMIFRGTIARSLASMDNKLAALALCGGLFAIFHANPAQTVHQFVLGAFLALLVLRSGSLWTGIAAHLFNNALVVALNYTALGTDSFWDVTANTGVVLGLMFAGIAGFALSLWGYVKTTESVWNATQRQTAWDNNSVIAMCVSAGVCAVLWVSNLLV